MYKMIMIKIKHDLQVQLQYKSFLKMYQNLCQYKQNTCSCGTWARGTKSTAILASGRHNVNNRAEPNGMA